MTMYCSVHRRKMVQDDNCDFGILFYCPKCEPEAYEQQKEIEEEIKRDDKERKQTPIVTKQLINSVTEVLKFKKALLNSELLTRLVSHHMSNGIEIESINWGKKKFGIFDKDRIKDVSKIYQIVFKNKVIEKC